MKEQYNKLLRHSSMQQRKIDSMQKTMEQIVTNLGALSKVVDRIDGVGGNSVKLLSLIDQTLLDVNVESKKATTTPTLIVKPLHVINGPKNPVTTMTTTTTITSPTPQTMRSKIHSILRFISEFVRNRLCDLKKNHQNPTPHIDHCP